jgi:hypothetical protein
MNSRYKEISTEVESVLLYNFYHLICQTFAKLSMTHEGYLYLTLYM